MMDHDADHLPIPMPITSKYIGDHHQPHPLSHHHPLIQHHGLSSPHEHHHHIHPSSNNGPSPPPPSKLDAVHYNTPGSGVNNNSATIKVGGNGSASGGGSSSVRYRECLKNHAASIGGTALDGCGEFMPAGEDGTMEALKCSACGCHRNFHRKEQEGSVLPVPGPGDIVPFDYYAAAHPQHHYFKPMSSSAGSGRNLVGQKGVLYHDYPYGQPPPLPLLPLRSPHGHPHHHYHHHHMSPMPLGAMQATSESDEMDGVGGYQGGPTPPAMMKKRFRTKFTVEQKERMLEFAERAGWRLQRTEEAVVQQFCQEIGVKRRVLKVWMHNNKHNLARRGVSVGGMDVGGATTPISTDGGSDGGGGHDHNVENSANSHHSHNDVSRAPVVQMHIHPLDHHQQQQQQRHGC